MLVSGIVVFVALCGFAMGQAQNFNMTRINLSQPENSIFGKWGTPTLTPGKDGNALSAVLVVKSKMPAEMMVTILPKMSGSAMPKIEMTVCEAFASEFVGKDLAKNGKVTECPIPEGEYKINNFLVSKDKAPQIPDGIVEGVMTLHMPDGEDLVIVDFEVSVKREMPGIG